MSRTDRRQGQRGDRVRIVGFVAPADRERYAEAALQERGKPAPALKAEGVLSRLFGRTRSSPVSSEVSDPVERAFQAGFLDAGRAKASFAALYGEDKRFAVWCLEKRPEMFGRLRADGTRPKVGRDALHQAFRSATPAAEINAGQRAQVNQVAEAAAQRIDGLRKEGRKAYGRRASAGALDALAKDYSGLPDADPAITQRLRDQAQAAAKGKIAEASKGHAGPDSSPEDPTRAAKFRAGERAREAGREPCRPPPIRRPRRYQGREIARPARADHQGAPCRPWSRRPGTGPLELPAQSVRKLGAFGEGGAAPACR